jgi:hypothetical protein
MDVQVIDIIGLTSRNNHMRAKEIDAVKPTSSIIRPWRKINTMFGRTKHLLTLQMKSSFCE